MAPPAVTCRAADAHRLISRLTSGAFPAGARYRGRFVCSLDTTALYPSLRLRTPPYLLNTALLAHPSCRPRRSRELLETAGRLEAHERRKGENAASASADSPLVFPEVPKLRPHILVTQDSAYRPRPFLHSRTFSVSVPMLGDVSASVNDVSRRQVQCKCVQPQKRRWWCLGSFILF